jgi:hypothetical protein
MIDRQLIRFDIISFRPVTSAIRAWRATIRFPTARKPQHSFPRWQLTDLGHVCDVVAPTMIPKRSMGAVRVGSASSLLCRGDIGKRRLWLPLCAWEKSPLPVCSTALWMARASVPMSSNGRGVWDIPPDVKIIKGHGGTPPASSTASTYHRTIIRIRCSMKRWSCWSGNECWFPDMVSARIRRPLVTPLA